MKTDKRRFDCGLLKAVLVRRKIRQYELAQALEMREADLSHIATGRVMPSDNVLNRLCKVLKIKRADLLSSVSIPLSGI